MGPGYILLWGGATEEPEFLLVEEVHEGGPVRGRSARGGRRDEALEEADWEMSAGGGSRERDCAGRAVSAERGYGVGLLGGLAGRQMAVWGRRSRSWPSARRGCCDSSSAGKLLSARREGNRPVTSGYPGILRVKEARLVTECVTSCCLLIPFGVSVSLAEVVPQSWPFEGGVCLWGCARL